MFNDLCLTISFKDKLLFYLCLIFCITFCLNFFLKYCLIFTKTHRYPSFKYRWLRLKFVMFNFNMQFSTISPCLFKAIPKKRGKYSTLISSLKINSHIYARKAVIYPKSPSFDQNFLGYRRFNRFWNHSL